MNRAQWIDFFTNRFFAQRSELNRKIDSMEKFGIPTTIKDESIQVNTSVYPLVWIRILYEVSHKT